MKRPKDDHSNGKNKRRIRHVRNRDHHVTEMLKLCLQKVCELQADLNSEEDVHDAEAAGYTACVMETIRFLSSQGLSPDHPVVRGLTEKLLKNRD